MDLPANLKEAQGGANRKLPGCPMAANGRHGVSQNSVSRLGRGKRGAMAMQMAMTSTPSAAEVQQSPLKNITVTSQTEKNIRSVKMEVLRSPSKNTTAQGGSQGERNGRHSSLQGQTSILGHLHRNGSPLKRILSETSSNLSSRSNKQETKMVPRYAFDQRLAKGSQISSGSHQVDDVGSVHARKPPQTTEETAERLNIIRVRQDVQGSISKAPLSSSDNHEIISSSAQSVSAGETDEMAESEAAAEIDCPLSASECSQREKASSDNRENIPPVVDEMETTVEIYPRPSIAEALVVANSRSLEDTQSRDNEDVDEAVGNKNEIRFPPDTVSKHRGGGEFDFSNSMCVVAPEAVHTEAPSLEVDTISSPQMTRPPSCPVGAGWRGGVGEISAAESSMCFASESSVTSLTVTPDGLYVIAGCVDGSVRLFDMECSNLSDRHGCIVGSLATGGMYMNNLRMHVQVAEGGKYCFAGARRGSAEVMIIDLHHFRQLRKRRGFAHADGLKIYRYSHGKLKGFGAVTALRYQVSNPDASARSETTCKEQAFRLLCGLGIKNLHVWDVLMCEDEEPHWSCIFDEQTNGNTLHLLSFQDHGRTAVSRSDDRNLRVWDLRRPWQRPVPYVDIKDTNDAHVALDAKIFGGIESLQIINLSQEKKAESRSVVEIPAQQMSEKAESRKRRRRMRDIKKVVATEHDNTAIVLCSDNSAFLFFDHELEKHNTPRLSPVTLFPRGCGGENAVVAVGLVTQKPTRKPKLFAWQQTSENSPTNSSITETLTESPEASSTVPCELQQETSPKVVIVTAFSKSEHDGDVIKVEPLARIRSRCSSDTLTVKEKSGEQSSIARGGPCWWCLDELERHWEQEGQAKDDTWSQILAEKADPADSFRETAGSDEGGPNKKSERTAKDTECSGQNISLSNLSLSSNIFQKDRARSLSPRGDDAKLGQSSCVKTIQKAKKKQKLRKKLPETKAKHVIHNGDDHNSKGEYATKMASMENKLDILRRRLERKTREHEQKMKEVINEADRRFVEEKRLRKEWNEQYKQLTGRIREGEDEISNLRNQLNERGKELEHIKSGGHEGMDLQELRQVATTLKASLQSNERRQELAIEKLLPSLCVICRDRKAETAIVPCGHLCLCENCVAQLHSTSVKRCPVCQGAKLSVLRIYHP